MSLQLTVFLIIVNLFTWVAKRARLEAVLAQNVKEGKEIPRLLFVLFMFVVVVKYFSFMIVSPMFILLSIFLEWGPAWLAYIALAGYIYWFLLVKEALTMHFQGMSTAYLENLPIWVNFVVKMPEYYLWFLAGYSLSHYI